MVELHREGEGGGGTPTPTLASPRPLRCCLSEELQEDLRLLVRLCQRDQRGLL